MEADFTSVCTNIFLRMQLFVSRPIALNQALKVPNDFKDIKDFNVVKALVRALGTKAKWVL